MANKTSLIITSTDTGGKTFNKTLTDVNAHATAENLQAFAQGLNSLTTNTFNSAALVERTEIVDKTELPLAHVEFTIGDRTYTEADADMTQSTPTLTLTFNASDTTYVKTNSDGRKEVQFSFNYIETSATAAAYWRLELWDQGCPRPSFGVYPQSLLCNGKVWGIHSQFQMYFRCEFFDTGEYKDKDAFISIGGTKARRGWLINVKLNREG